MSRVVALAVCALAVVACGRSDGPERPDRIAHLERLVTAWEQADGVQRSPLLARAVFAFGLAHNQLPTADLPEAVRDLAAADAILGEMVQEHERPTYQRAWRVGNLWFIEGLQIQGRRLLLPADPGEGQLPRLQAFTLTTDLVVHLSPGGTQTLLVGPRLLAVGATEDIVVP